MFDGGAAAGGLCSGTHRLRALVRAVVSWGGVWGETRMSALWACAPGVSVDSIEGLKAKLPQLRASFTVSSEAFKCTCLPVAAYVCACEARVTVPRPSVAFAAGNEPPCGVHLLHVCGPSVFQGVLQVVARRGPQDYVCVSLRRPPETLTRTHAHTHTNPRSLLALVPTHTLKPPPLPFHKQTTHSPALPHPRTCTYANAYTRTPIYTRPALALQATPACFPGEPFGLPW